MDRRTLPRTSVQLTLLAPFARLSHAAAARRRASCSSSCAARSTGSRPLPPYADPQYRNLRGALALDAPGSDGGVLKLDGTFGLHPSLANMHAMYQANELAVLHAVATPYRERSHFDAQKLLEAGGLTPSTSDGGWLNRALALMLEREGSERDAIALSDKRAARAARHVGVGTWAPSQLPDTDADLLARVRRMYEASDPRARGPIDRGARRARHRRRCGRGGHAAWAARAPACRSRRSRRRPRASCRARTARASPRSTSAAGTRTPTKARARAISRCGCAGSTPGCKRCKPALGPAWARHAVLIVTEFGRTVAVNGTRGTDHGTAGCAFLAGGAVNGGRVLADWPGLAQRDLHEGRDLRATTDLRGVFKGVLATRFGIRSGARDERVPGQRERRAARAYGRLATRPDGSRRRRGSHGASDPSADASSARARCNGSPAGARCGAPAPGAPSRTPQGGGEGYGRGTLRRTADFDPLGVDWAVEGDDRISEGDGQDRHSKVVGYDVFVHVEKPGSGEALIAAAGYFAARRARSAPAP